MKRILLRELTMLQFTLWSFPSSTNVLTPFIVWIKGSAFLSQYLTVSFWKQMKSRFLEVRDKPSETSRQVEIWLLKQATVLLLFGNFCKRSTDNGWFWTILDSILSAICVDPTSKSGPKLTENQICSLYFQQKIWDIQASKSAKAETGFKFEHLFSWPHLSSFLSFVR